MDIDAALDELLLSRPVAENDIVQAHRRMAMRFHPDKARDPDEKRWVQQKFVRIQQAYELLKGLPIEIVNGSPERKVSQESAIGSSEQPIGRSPQQPRHEEPRPSDPIGAFLGFLLLVAMMFSVYFVIQFAGRPEKLSGSPVLSMKQKPLSKDLSWIDDLRDDGTTDAAAAKEFQQTFGRLLTIGHDPNGAYFACFERINQPVYNDQRIRGFWVRVLPHYVIFFKEHASGRGTCRLSQ